MNYIYDLIIIGAGPAGLTASIYAKRALLKCLIIEKQEYLRGGKLKKTKDIDNYPGFITIGGPELAIQMIEHAENYKIDWQYKEVTNLKKENDLFVIETNEGENFFGKSVIIASGTEENKLKILGEKKFTNFGVSYCAICDGFVMREKKIVVVGGGYSALETALFMRNIATKVYLVHRRNEFRAEKEIVDKIKNDPKISLILNSNLIEIQGEETVKSVIIKNLSENNNKYKLLVEAVFPCIGLSPFSKFSHELGICDSENYISIKDDCSTSVLGLFAAGDIARTSRNKIKQIVTAVAEGAIAAQSVIKYLEKNRT